MKKIFSTIILMALAAIGTYAAPGENADWYFNSYQASEPWGSTGSGQVKVSKLAGGDISLVPAYEAAGDKWLDGSGNEIADIVTYLNEKCPCASFR